QVAHAASEFAEFSGVSAAAEVTDAPAVAGGRITFGEFIRDRRMLLLLLGTAGSWFLFDYAYYGNTLSLPVILSKVDVTASLSTKLALTLAMFVVFAVPGYV